MTNNKSTHPVCHCKAYEWPHRWKSGKCKTDKPVERVRVRQQFAKDFLKK